MRVRERLRYVPLIGLLIAVIVATVLGVVAGSRDAAPEEGATPLEPTAAVNELGSGGGLAPTGMLPDCQSLVPEPAAQQPWEGEARAASEAVFAEHAPREGRIVIGQDRWVFWSDYQWENFSQALGRRTLSDREMSAWATAFGQLRDDLAADGIPLVILIAPAKWDAYPDKLPDWASELRGATTLDRIRLAHPDLPIVDVRAALSRARTGTAERPAANTYEPNNSHWTDYGGFVAWETLSPCIASLDESFADVRPAQISGVSTRASNNEFAPDGIANGAAASTVPDWSEPSLGMQMTDGEGRTREVTSNYRTDLTETPATTRTPDAHTDATALVLRDSFGTALAPGLQRSFTRTVQIDLAVGSEREANIRAAVTKHRPDIVIVEMTERYLRFIPNQPRD